MVLRLILNLAIILVSHEPACKTQVYSAMYNIVFKKKLVSTVSSAPLCEGTQNNNM